VTYKDNVRDFEKRVAPYISSFSTGISYCGCICSVYHFLSSGLLQEWRRLGDRKVLILGSWGPKSLVIGVRWDREKWHSSDPIKRVEAWSQRYCPGMMEEVEWTLNGLKMKKKGWMGG
jgi:hypothetical protein